MTHVLKLGALTAVGALLALPVMAQNINPMSSPPGQSWNSDQSGYNEPSRFSTQNNYDQGWNGEPAWNTSENQYGNGQYGQNQYGSDRYRQNRYGNQQNPYGNQQYGQNQDNWTGGQNQGWSGNRYGQNQGWRSGPQYGQNQGNWTGGQTGYSNNYVPNGYQSGMPTASMNGSFEQNKMNQGHSGQRFSQSGRNFGQGYSQGEQDFGPTHQEDFTGNRE